MAKVTLFSHTLHILQGRVAKINHLRYNPPPVSMAENSYSNGHHHFHRLCRVAHHVVKFTEVGTVEAHDGGVVGKQFLCQSNVFLDEFPGSWLFRLILAM